MKNKKRLFLAALFLAIGIAAGCQSKEQMSGTGLTATVTPTLGPTATATPEPTVTPTPEPAATATPEPTSTPTPEPAATATPEPTSTPTPESTATATPEPTSIPTPRPTATATTAPEPTSTSTPEPTATPKPTKEPEPTVTSTPEPMATATPESTSTSTPESTTTPTPTNEPAATATPEPTSTPMPTNEPTVTPTPKPTATTTPEPTSTPTPKPTEASKPTATPKPTASASGDVITEDRVFKGYANRYDKTLTIKSGVQITFGASDASIDIAKGLIVEEGATVKGPGMLLFRYGSTCSGLELWYNNPGNELVPMDFELTKVWENSAKNNPNQAALKQATLIFNWDGSRWVLSSNVKLPYMPPDDRTFVKNTVLYGSFNEVENAVVKSGARVTFHTQEASLTILKSLTVEQGAVIEGPGTLNLKPDASYQGIELYYFNRNNEIIPLEIELSEFKKLFGEGYMVRFHWNDGQWVLDGRIPDTP